MITEYIYIIQSQDQKFIVSANKGLQFGIETVTVKFNVNTAW